MSPTVYLISGANRGIGLGLVNACLKRPETVVFAGARNPSDAPELEELCTKYPQRLHVAKIVSSDKAGNEEAIRQVKEIAGRLDVVIANAGIGNYIGKAIDTPADVMAEHYNVNVIGTLTLFQAAYPLLIASTPTPKFIAIGSGSGSLKDGAVFPLGVLAYGASKAAENYLSRRLHGENPELVSFSLSPGATDTDLMRNTFKRVPNGDALAKNLAPVDEVCEKLFRIVEDATREKYGGMFVKTDGSIQDW